MSDKNKRRASSALKKLEKMQLAEPVEAVPEVTGILLKCYQIIGAETDAFKRRKDEDKMIDVRHFKALVDSLKIVYELEELEIARMKRLGVLDRYVAERYSLED